MATINADEFLKRGFSYLSKQDYEIILFHELMKLSDYNGKTDYELSILFRTTPKKISDLRNVCEAFYNTDSLIEKARIDFLNIVKQSHVLQDNHTVKLLINNKNTMNYIVSLMNDNMMLSDTSFNRNILKIDIEDYITLLGKLDDKTKELNNLLKKLNSRLPKNEAFDWTKLLKDFVSGIAEVTLGKLGGKLVDLSFEGLCNIVKQLESKTNK